MSDDTAARKLLAEQWQKTSIELIRRGVAPAAVFDTMVAIGLAGYVEIHGRQVAAEKLLSLANQLSDEIRKQAEAMNEAQGATKN